VCANNGHWRSTGKAAAAVQRNQRQPAQHPSAVTTCAGMKDRSSPRRDRIG
jgi:hypothetical protein